jgi:NADH:ubiquinone oxidoreductase subunit K
LNNKNSIAKRYAKKILYKYNKYFFSYIQKKYDLLVKDVSIAIEIMLLAVTLLVLITSFGFDDNVGQTFSLYIISIAGAESVIGLSILVAFYRLRGTISIRN